MPEQVEWRFYVHGDGRYASINDGRTGDTLLRITDRPVDAWGDIAKAREFERHFRSLPAAIVKQRDEELRERKKQGVAAMIRTFQDERGAIELTEWGPRFYRLIDAAFDSIFEEAD
jgi:hypothetical protein